LEQNQVISFHDRAAIVARDILQQIGLDEEKVRMITGMTSAITMLPPIGPLAAAQNLVKEIEPLLLLAQNNIDPGAYIKAIPQEKIEYFLNQVITRLEWVKYGNNESEDVNPEHQNNK
jgi:hypothetical protein